MLFGSVLEHIRLVLEQNTNGIDIGPVIQEFVKMAVLPLTPSLQVVIFVKQLRVLQVNVVVVLLHQLVVRLVVIGKP